MRSLLVSVVVSAHGNGACLARLLDALAGQTFPADCLEAVVVDNEPHRRRGVVATAVGAAVGHDGWPFPVRVHREPLPGLSRGRNRGIQAARGRYVVVTDPDIVPDPGWLAALVTAAEGAHAVMVGGRVVSAYLEGSALALHRSRRLRECHGPLDWPRQQSAAAWPYWVSGCNLLVERAIALELGLFRTDLGRRGRWLGGCEDLELAEHARQRGLRMVIEPAAVVLHPVYRRETTPGYFLAQGVGHGVSVARMRQSVAVEQAALRAGRRDAWAAAIQLAGGLACRDAVRAVEGARDLA